jgi:hypothetical protein
MDGAYLYHKRSSLSASFRWFEEGNTNYSCNAIIFDRIFGTYSEGPIDKTGIGPSEPNLMEKLMLPFREPADITTAPRSSRAQID